MATLATESLSEVATKLGAHVAKSALVSGRCSEREVATILGAEVANARQAFKCSTRHRKARRDALGQTVEALRHDSLRSNFPNFT